MCPRGSISCREDWLQTGNHHFWIVWRLPVAITVFSTSLHVLERDDMEILFCLGSSYHQCRIFLNNLNYFEVKRNWVALVPVLVPLEC